MNIDCLTLIINEVRNFNKLKIQYNYVDLNDLIAHYIEEGVISSRAELIKVLTALKKKFRIMLNENTFNDWWVTSKY